MSFSDMDALVEASRGEGTSVIYSSFSEAINEAIAAGFSEEYGIDVEVNKLSGSEVAVRYQSEASAGRVLADAALLSCPDEAFYVDSVASGWAEAVGDLDLPSFSTPEGAELLRYDGDTAVFAHLPMGIAYNTDLVQGDDIPTSWKDLLKPEFAGKIVMVDPNYSAFYDFFLTFLVNEYGEEFLIDLAAQDLQMADPSTARNQLAAGQGWLSFPENASGVSTTAATGAPLAQVLPADAVTGTEMCMVISSADSAPNPNTARLIAYYLTSPAGGDAISAVPGAVSPFSSAGLPENYRALPTADEVDSAKLHELLGLD